MRRALSLSGSIIRLLAGVRSRSQASARGWIPDASGVMAIVAVALALGVPIAVNAAPPSPAVRVTEPEIKGAAFLNIIAFTHWPADSFATSDAPLVIGILGQGPVAAVIERLVQGETWQSRQIVVRRFESVADVKSCHVVFVARSEHSHWSEIRAQLANQPTLAVSDSDNFAQDGGNVQLVMERNKLHIVVNLARTRASGLQLSSNLLRLSTIVGPAGEPSAPPHSALPRSLFDGFALALALLH